MITTIATFNLPQPITRAEARAIFQSTAPNYLGLKGLVRKIYVLSQDGQTAGGVYIWNSKADADALFNETWREFVREKYGTYPTLTYFDSPVLVDNVVNNIITD